MLGLVCASCRWSRSTGTLPDEPSLAANGVTPSTSLFRSWGRVFSKRRKRGGIPRANREDIRACDFKQLGFDFSASFPRTFWGDELSGGDRRALASAVHKRRKLPNPLTRTSAPDPRKGPLFDTKKQA